MAELVKSVLAGNGIEAIVSGDDCAALDAALSLVRGVRVMVMSDRVEEAEQVIESAGLSLPPEDEA